MIEIPCLALNKVDNSLRRVSHNSLDQGQTDVINVVNHESEIFNFKAYFITYSKRIFDFLNSYEASVILLSGNEYIVNDGDIVWLSGDFHKIIVMYYASSRNNALFLTARCNQRCIMCVQPPQMKDEFDFVDIANKIIDLAPQPETIVITGGEPTLVKEKLLDLIKKINLCWPQTYVTVLSNARLFSFNYVVELEKVINKEMFSVGIPLHSDISEIHDKIAGATGAFTDTVRGLINLSTIGVYIELRIIVTKFNIHRLSCIVEYVAKNLPFIARIAIIQMEPYGLARKAWKNLWIASKDYQQELYNAVRLAENFNFPVYLYNFQLCGLSSELRKYARSSISDWKNNYHVTCNRCALKSQCGGLFSSQDNYQYLPELHPISL